MDFDNKRILTVQVKVTPNEKKLFEDSAKGCGLSLSAWIRHKLLTNDGSDVDNVVHGSDSTIPAQKPIPRPRQNPPKPKAPPSIPGVKLGKEVYGSVQEEDDGVPF